MLPTERPDTWEVRGRGELALAVLVETMRREGYELTVGRPAAVTREVDGAVYEPVERLSVDVPEEYLGAVTSLIAVRRGRMESMTNHGTGWVRLEFVVPARGLIGFRTQFLTETRGTGIAHHVFEGYEPWPGAMRGRATGSLVADRSGSATPYAMFNLQERGSLFVAPGTEVYEGMIVGENSRPDDMDVNITRERKVTNVRQSTGEELERLVPPRLLSLEQALEFCADDECVEVTAGRRAAAQDRPGREGARPGQRGRASRGGERLNAAAPSGSRRGRARRARPPARPRLSWRGPPRPRRPGALRVGRRGPGDPGIPGTTPRVTPQATAAPATAILRSPLNCFTSPFPGPVPMAGRQFFRSLLPPSGGCDALGEDRNVLIGDGGVDSNPSDGRGPAPDQVRQPARAAGRGRPRRGGPPAA